MIDTNNTTITLHGFPVSPHVRAVRIALLEKGLNAAFEAIGPDTLATDDYARINPFRRMPTLVHGDLILYETPALMVYADESGSGAPLQPQGAAERATMWKFIGIAQNYLYPQGVMALFFHRVLAGVFGMEPDNAAADAGVPGTTTALDVIETALGSSEYLAGPALSLADIYCGTMVDYVGRTVDGQSLLRDRPRTAAWVRRLRDSESFRATYPEMLAGAGEPVT